jgi:cytochrome c-type biogenesis protein CcmH/NrfG
MSATGNDDRPITHYEFQQMWERHDRRRRDPEAQPPARRRCEDRVAELQSRIAENAQGMTTSIDGGEW